MLDLQSREEKVRCIITVICAVSSLVMRCVTHTSPLYQSAPQIEVRRSFIWPLRRLSARGFNLVFLEPIVAM